MKTMPALEECLRELTRNMWWCWHPEVWGIFETIDDELWRSTNHNPTAFLDQVDDEVLARRIDTGPVASRIRHQLQRMRRHREAGGPEANPAAGRLHTAPVAYLCAEFGLHESLPIHSGELGVVAGDVLKAAAELGVPVVGVGLFYSQGHFRQGIDERGRQHEYRREIDAQECGLARCTHADGTAVTIQVDIGEQTVAMQVWQADVGRSKLFLLDADIPANPGEWRRLTKSPARGDRQARLRRGILLGVGGVRLLERLGIRPGVYHLNEGHSASAALELCARLMENEQLAFEQARNRVCSKTIFTPHTPPKSVDDRFEPRLIDEALDELRTRLGLDLRQFHGLGRTDLDDADELFSMTVAALKISGRRFGISHLQGRVNRRKWQRLWPRRSPQEVPIGHVTHGAHLPSGLAGSMKALFDRHLPADWMQRVTQPDVWAPIADVDPAELWEVHQRLKVQLLDFVRRRVRTQNAPGGGGDQEVVPASGMRPDVLTIGVACRFRSSARPGLILRDTDRFRRLVDDAERPIQIIFAGKADPGDEQGRRLLETVVDHTTDPRFCGRVAFVADCDINVARRLVQGVDLWLNTSRRTRRPFGVRGQQAVINGVLNCSTLDGWYAEAYDGKNGFAIGDGRHRGDPRDQDDYDLTELYRLLESEVVPMYYRHDDGLPHEWIQRVNWAIRSLAWRYNARRMVRNYLNEAYLPAAGATTHRGV